MPPRHLDHVVHRQPAPEVGDRGQILQALVRDQQHVRVRGRGHRGERAAGPRGHQVVHPFGLGRLVGVPEPAQPLDRPGPAPLGEVAALREDDHRVARAGPAGQRGDRLGDVVGDVRVRGDEAVRQPVEQHVDGRVELQRVLEHDPRPQLGERHQLADQQHRVARPGVPAEHQLRPVPAERAPVAGADHPQPERPPRGSVDPIEHPAEQPVVGFLPALIAEAVTEAGAQPHPAERPEGRPLAGEPDDAEPQQPQPAPLPGQERRRSARR